MIERDIESELVVNVRHCFVAVDLKQESSHQKWRVR